MSSLRILTLPGWQGSGPGHWQSLWERSYGYQRVEQHDWQRPLRGDWIARLDEVLLQSPVPAVLVAHSLGCIQVAAWAAHSRHTARVKAAFLVAPGDAEQESLRGPLHSWSPIALQTLPFQSLLLHADNDPYCSTERARYFAQNWGAQYLGYGAYGHINAESGLGDWPQGQALLQGLIASTPTH